MYPGVYISFENQSSLPQIMFFPGIPSPPFLFQFCLWLSWSHFSYKNPYIAQFIFAPAEKYSPLVVYLLHPVVGDDVLVGGA